MQAGFWGKLKKPIMVMAPMANVTDAAFRRMFAEVGKPDVFWTEFVSVEGLLSRGREQLLIDFWKTDLEHPIVAQIFGDKPEQFGEVAHLVRELGFDGVDINMGCPDSGVEKSGAGASLIKRPEIAREIIRATKRGASDGAAAPAIPVSVKTRLGYRSTDEMTDWLTTILKEDVAVLTVHLRTRNEMSDVAAHWDLARSIVELRDKLAPETLILANGDVASLAEAEARVAETGVDGVMIGRGLFGNPWFFRKDLGGHAPNLHEQLTRMVTHTELFESLYKSNLLRGREHEKKQGGERPLKSFDVMKKHFKAYCSGFDDAKELRMSLMETHSAAQVRELVEKFLETHSA